MNHRLRRRLLVFAPIVALLAFLLWPLSSRMWDISPADGSADPEDATKEGFLAGQIPVSRNAPRVIVIIADDLGPTDIALYGGRNVRTPNIDSIGTDGVTFTAATCTTAICAPSRASLLTGRYQQRFGFELQPHDRYARNRLEYIAFRYFIDTSPMVPIEPAPIPSRRAQRDQGIPESEVMLSELLRARGYETAIFGKWHLGYEPELGPLARGFDQHYGFYEAFSLYSPVNDESVVHTPIDDFSDQHMWNRGREKASAIVRNDVVVEELDYLTFRFADLAAEYIGANADEPFFLYLPFNAPHTPLQAPVEYYDELDHIDDPIRRTYYAMIAALDDAVGTVLDAVDEAGIAESTLVVFASDNGGVTYLGVTDNGPFAGGKFSTFEGGVSVPMMMRYPAGIPAGTVYESPVSLLDIFATVDAITVTDPSDGSSAGTDPVSHQSGGAGERGSGIDDSTIIDGVNLLPYIRGEIPGDPHEALFWRSAYNSAVRSGAWKMIIQAEGSPGRDDSDLELLFNLELDPYERTNVARENPEVVARLRELLARWESDLVPPAWPPVMHFWIDVWGERYWFAI